MYPKALVMFAELKAAELNGVYPRAVVMSDDEIEKTADRAFVPVLDRVNTLVPASAFEKEIAFTK